MMPNNTDQMFDALTAVMQHSIQVSGNEIELCKEYFEPLTISKNTVLEEQGKIPQYLYFVSLGYMRLFYYDQNGDEQTTCLCRPNGFIASFLSFINQVSAAENVECVTDCNILRVSNASLRQMIEVNENFKKFSLTIFEKAMAAAALRANDLATLTAEQRYKKLMNDQPELIQNIPLQYIASYLGIKPESLSRIRRQIIS